MEKPDKKDLKLDKKLGKRIKLIQNWEKSDKKETKEKETKAIGASS